MAYNGRDVRREEISMTKLLRPKATVNVRVRRDGKEKELPVVVAVAPPRVQLRRTAEIGDAGAPWVEVPSAPVLGRGPFSAPAPTAPRKFAPRARASVPVVATTPRAPLPPVFDLAPSGIAGAQMTTVSEAMKRSWNLPAGVLVTMVPTGSPAAESGLEDGDVILRANQHTVTRFVELRDAVARASEDGERSVTLDVRRGKQRRALTLRW
jgi:S1-C subfamily serine protease